MNQSFSEYTRRDWVIAVLLTIFILLLVGMQLTPGIPMWVGDAAAYLSEGIAISNGTLEEQTAINCIMHPSPLPEEVHENRLVYVWGYPLLLSLVHQMVGFDMVNYSSIIFYKLPSLLAFSLMAGVLFLFYRRFFEEKLAVFLTLIFCAGSNIFLQVDTLLVDIFFLFIALLSLWLAECFFADLEKPISTGKKALLIVCLAISMWFTNQTRLNGSTVVLIILLSHILRLVERKAKLSIRLLWVHLCPYAIYLILNVLSEWILFPATPNVSDIGSITLSQFFTNCHYYLDKTCEYLNDLAGKIGLFPIPLLFLLVGFFKTGFRLRNLPYTVLLAGTYGVLVLLPYVQGLRYLYNVLPILVLYTAWGGQAVFQWLLSRKAVSPVLLRKGIAVAAAILLLLVYFPVLQSCVLNITGSQDPADGDVYSKEAVEIYHYIQDNTEPDAVIAFMRPRLLYLNTGRISFAPNVNHHKLEDADFFLDSDVPPFAEFSPTEEERAALEVAYQNKTFTLYKLQK